VWAESLEEPSHWRACLLFVGEREKYRPLLCRDRALLHKSLGGHLGSVLVVATSFRALLRRCRALLQGYISLSPPLSLSRAHANIRQAARDSAR